MIYFIGTYSSVITSFSFFFPFNLTIRGIYNNNKTNEERRKIVTAMSSFKTFSLNKEWKQKEKKKKIKEKNENHEKGRKNDDKNINAKWNWNLFWIIQNTEEGERKKQFLHPFPSHSIWDDNYHNIKTSLLSFSWLWLCLLSSFYYISYFFMHTIFNCLYLSISYPIPFVCRNYHSIYINV